MRVSEFAKELGRSNKEILDILAAQGVTGKTHSSNVSDAEMKNVRTALEPAGTAAKKEGTAPAAPAASRKSAAESGKAPQGAGQAAQMSAGGQTAAGSGAADRRTLDVRRRTEHI